MTNVRETKRADELKPGDWTIHLGKVRDFDGLGRAEILFAHPYTDEVGNARVYVTAAEVGYSGPQSARLSADERVQVLGEDEIQASREQAERAQRIADIRAFADFLDQNPWAPLPYENAQAEIPFDNIREYSERVGVPVDEHLDDRTQVFHRFGGFEYRVVAWHQDGRPAEPAPEPEPEEARCPDCGEPMRLIGLGYVGHIPGEACSPDADPTGLAYSREADDPTPVSGARVEPHTGGVTEAGLVDETEPKCTPECDAMTTRPEITGMARGYHHDDCPVVPVLETADRARLAGGGEDD